MILLHDPLLIFLKPHKVAGTSFEIALSRFAGPRDIITPIGKGGAEGRAIRQRLGFRDAQNYRWPLWQLPFIGMQAWGFARARGVWPTRFRSHSSAAEVKARLGAEHWDTSVKLSIIRNPYDVAVSTYFWMRQEGQSFADFWFANPALLRRNQSQYWIGGEDVIDLYLRYEHMAQDIAALEARYAQLAGLGDTFASLSAKSGFRPKEATAQALFDTAPQIAKLVKHHNRFEIERFGYTL